ncbi:MAG: RidA family protein [Planctomycetota bacterium]
MERTPICTTNAPSAIGPYVQAVDTGSLVFCSGQIPLDPETGRMVSDSIRAATDRAIRNLAAVLEEANLSLQDVVKTTVFVKHLDDFAVVNEVYASHFGAAPPARSCVEVARLPKDALVEIEAIALRG